MTTSPATSPAVSLSPDLIRDFTAIVGPAHALTDPDAQISYLREMRDLGKRALQRSLARAEVGVADIDVFQIYDPCSFEVLRQFEMLGLCAEGEGGAFVSGGRIAPGGELPVNTNGGGLSCTHPGMYGIFIMIEAVRQLRGSCDERQVKDAKLAVVHGNGGTLSSQSTAILGTEETL